ncbi:DUF4221 family protein [Pararhodonellum marinum]|uniref:DUF4221 family protein n=1 Tax=Pararhodonellum marinum TaxID=2755358 RepID=UPI00188F0EBC|nr:DUF4221 family protein [Pararhodonellum marinum]
MKNQLIILLSVLLFACGKNKNETQTDFSNISFSMDTVVVDPGDEIIYLQWSLGVSDLSGDKNFLYNFNMNDYTLEKIDLEELKLVEKLPYEKEGPNGLGMFPNDFYVLGEDRFFIGGFEAKGFYNHEGERLEKFDFKKREYEGGGFLEGEDFSSIVSLEDQPQTFYGLLRNWTDKSVEFAKLNHDANQFKKYELPEFVKLKDFFMELNDGTRRMIMGPSIMLDASEGKIILSNDAANEFYWYDIEKDSLYYQLYESQLTENERKIKFPPVVESQAELREMMEKAKEEIRFMAPVWDEEKALFYRFSYIEKQAGQDSGTVESEANAQVYLTIFDRDLNMVGESPVGVLKKRPGNHFVKGGKIWMYENMDDELGFVRLSLLL